MSDLDAGQFLRSLAALKASCALYPEGHPSIDAHVEESYQRAHELIADSPRTEIDMLRGVVNLDGVASQKASRIHARAIEELASIGIESIHVDGHVSRAEFRSLGEYLAHPGNPGESQSVDATLRAKGIEHISLGRILPVDSFVPGAEWPEAPGEIFDADYRESVDRARDAFESFGLGSAPEASAIQQLLSVIVDKAAHSGVAMSQVLALKNYENLTYLHSVNVTLLSLRLGERVGLAESSRMLLAEAALLHDVGKTRIPLDILTKSGALTDRERREINSHPRMGAEILIELDHIASTSPIVALEHHIGFDGSGYPDLGPNRTPHPLSQIVSVVDIYESLTGARAYREPVSPEKACIALARLAGTALNPALVKAFVSVVTFFPIGSVVRTTQNELGVVVETFEDDALHPRIARVDEEQPDKDELEFLDLRDRDGQGTYVRQVAESLPAGAFAFDVPQILRSATA
jgi:HD-GYP domain-containing protein (c-di-GMP phosphodiesterase class II)